MARDGWVSDEEREPPAAEVVRGDERGGGEETDRETVRRLGAACAARHADLLRRLGE